MPEKQMNLHLNHSAALYILMFLSIYWLYQSIFRLRGSEEDVNLKECVCV